MSPSPTSQSMHHHKTLAATQGAIPVALVTVSDTRTEATDANKHYLETALQAAGHRLSDYRLIKDEADQVTAVLDELSAGEARIILFNGGTGISRRDTTIDVLNAKLEKHLPGFGELFRMVSYEQIGSAALFSRATAGAYRGKVIISIPGSPAAVQLAWEKLIAPELQHLAWEVAR
ncbi:MAG TPA: molybdenum cofactor biosynthesis protein B [Anaerolineae bacterium]|nr:molybdenum cofactor biosynthesis protein B [Anaerolineae bacterium]